MHTPSNADVYFSEGCGRCPLGGTPDCKVHPWRQELAALRRIVLDCGLVEERKWGVPCYTFRRHNIVILAALKECCTLGFFNGALLHDAQGLLAKPGPHSQATRQFRFANVREIVELEPYIKAYIHEAVELEKAGLKVEFKKNPEPVPEELQQKLDEIPALKAAFDALTPGRQRAYILFCSEPKQSKTRAARVEKCRPQILAGKGLRE